MTSIEEQLVVTSRKIADMVVANIGDNQSLFDETMDLFYRNEYPLSMRAGWIATFVAKKHPQLARPHLNRIVEILTNSKVDGVKRSALKILNNTPYELDEDTLGRLADSAFTLAEDPTQAIAVRAFSIDILLKILKTYPEIASEIIAVLESIAPEGSTGLKSKCYKTIAKLKKKMP